MRFKTTIEITSEAEDKNEAIEIVGEYLSGNLVSGVDMKCLTRPVHNYRRNAISVAVVSLLIGICILSSFSIKPSQNLISNASGINAIQPPLKTSGQDKKDIEFKKEWQNRQTSEALSYIKR